MGDVIYPTDAHPEAILTRAEWAGTRARYLAWTGGDDPALPYPTPPGHVWVRTVVGVQAVDPLPATMIVRWGQSSPVVPIRFRLLYDVALDRAEPAANLVGPSSQVMTTTKGELTTTVAGPATVPTTYGVVHPRPPDDLVVAYLQQTPGGFTGLPGPVWIGREVAPGLAQVHGRRAPAPAADAWHGSAWGRELALAFVPPQARAFEGSLFAAAVVPFGDDLTVDTVLTPANHPFLPAAALERQRSGPNVGGLVPVTARGFAFARREHEEPIRTPDGWTARYRRAEGTNVLQQIGGALQGVIDQARSIARETGRNLRRVASGDLAGLEALAVAAVATVVAGPAGLALAGSRDPWRDAARLGALHYALWASPLTRGFRAGLAVENVAGSPSATGALAGSPLRPGMTDLSLPTFTAGGFSATADDIAAAEIWAQRLSIASPEEAQRLLVRIADNGGYVDLVFARLVIEAEADKLKRDALKARLVAKQAEFYDRYGQYIVKALAVVPGIGTALTIASLLYQLAIAAQTVEVGLETARKAELAASRLERALLAELAEWEARERAATGQVPTPPGTDAPTATSTPARRRPWYFWLVEAWT